MISTIKLSYAEFNCNDLGSMANYYENVVGFSLTKDSTKDEKYFSSGLEHHNIALKNSDESALHIVGYQIEQKDSLENVQKYLKREFDINSEIKTDIRPGVAKLLELVDPDGYKLHLFQEVEHTAVGYKKNAINPFKIGHIALGSLNAQKSIDFYMNVLNFHYTDKIGTRATFLTCNSDHHVLNISTFGHKMLHHIAFELKDASHHVLSSDHLASHGTPIKWGPFRHTAGHNLASYHQDPEKNVIELYTDMDQFIPELNYFDPRPWHETLPLRPRVWDHNCAWYEAFETNITDIVLQKLESEPVI
ncbi:MULTISPECIES: VOC family protein [Peribacillus]|uniref:VOC family protein n=1 Tax=Peribacillus TaxID=2675229 RepID=UPI001F4EB019|nr:MULTISPECIES: VOC family protein [unclassified Peribacillus]MCK1983595.1 VOC family protein [Peribacillus sp. Aquil_B1]MCK2006613.1 VOC family protein [Peribacillus sp. Aquil_B8]